MSRPAAWNMSAIATVWLDVETGIGVDDQGRAVRPLLGGRRSKPTLVDLLNTGAHHGATRVMLSGKFPTVSAQRAHWLLVSTEGWVGGGHYIKDDRPPRVASCGCRTDRGSRSGWRGSGSGPTTSAPPRPGRR